MVNKKAITGCWCAAFVFGWLAGRKPVVVEPRLDEVPRADRRDPREFRKWTPFERVEALHRLAAIPFPRLEERLEMGKHVARLPLDEVKRLCMSSTENTEDPFGETSEENSGPSLLRGIAVDECCRRDPFGMLDFQSKWSDQDLSQIMFAAASLDPERARNLPIVKDGRFGYRARTGLLKGLAVAAPELAFATARELPQEEFEYTDLGVIAEGFNDTHHKLEWAELIFERVGSNKQPAIYQILQITAEDDSVLLAKSTDSPLLMHYETEVSGFICRQRWRNIPAGDPVPVPTPEEKNSIDENFDRRFERWFAKDPAAVSSWLDGLPDNGQRKSLVASLARAATLTDLQSLDRMTETFTSLEDLETIQRCAVFLLSDGNTSTRAALLAFVGKHPEARQYVRRPQLLEP